MTNSTKQSLRLFYALWPDDATRDAFMRLQAPIHGRKTRYENLHLTLAFLGRQPVELLPMLISLLEKISHQPVSIKLDRLGYFTQKKIVWAGMRESPAALTALRNSLRDVLVQNDIMFDNKSAFRPHVTLAQHADAPDELPFDPFTWQCRQLALVESSNTVEGVSYRVIASHNLMQDKAGA